MAEANHNFGEEEQSSKRRQVLRDYAQAVLFAILLSVILRMFVVQAFRIPTGSMKDTLLIGDFLLVNKFVYGARTPEGLHFASVTVPLLRLPALKSPSPGDIMVFKYPKNERMDYIKRCIAVGGQTVQIKNGDVFIDDKVEGEKSFIKKEYDPDEGHYVNYFRIDTEHGRSYVIRHIADSYRSFENYGPVTVPEGHFFMMGDNRDNSSDSRTWGFLPERNLVGEAMFIYWSWDNSTALDNLLAHVRWSRLGHRLE